MASCAYCGTTILFGGARQGELRFCNAKCQSKGGVLSAAARVPEGAAQNLAMQIHAGLCPRCKGAGPVDVHTSYRVWSALIVTQWQSFPQVSCRRCAVKSQVGNLAFSAFLGWWGFPWGFLVTPVQVVRNVIALTSPPNPSQPSPKLLQAARIQLASVPGSAVA